MASEQQVKHDRNSMNCRAFPFVFSANQVRRDRRGLVNLAVLCFGALLLGLFLTLPFGHQLFHGGGSEPENCPVRMLESSLVLLVGVILPLALLLAGTPPATGPLWSVPLPLFFRGFSFGNRAPPRT